MTVLTRAGSSSTKEKLPAGVAAVKEVDYSSVDSLTEALRGQDAVVNCINAQGDPTPSVNLILAAQAAGTVHRLIPSDFGMDAENAEVMALPVFGAKLAQHKVFKGREKETGIDWTIVTTGPFLDFPEYIGIDVRGRKVTWFGDASQTGRGIGWTRLDDIGKATAQALVHADETANRTVYICSTFKSQREMAALAKEAVGGGEGWVEENRDITADFAKAWEMIKGGDYSMWPMVTLIQYAAVSEPYNTPRDKWDNELLGVKQMSDEEVKAFLKSLL